MWDWGATPGGLVRCLGPWGPGITSKYCRSRFTRQQQLTEQEVAIFEQVGRAGGGVRCGAGGGVGGSLRAGLLGLWLSLPSIGSLAHPFLPLPRPLPHLQYHYHTLGQRGSGEHALRHILAPFAWPRQPLEERMRDLQVPVTFI